MRRLAFAAAAVATLSGGAPADGYKLRANAWVPTSENAIRWQESDFPLRFRMLENDNLPPNLGITQEGWADLVERSLAHWIRIPTARIGIVLDEEGVPLSQADADDGMNTIGFTADEFFVGHWATAFAAWRTDAGQLVGCDIEVNPDFVKNWAPQDAERLLEIIITHEMGHCLGLGHTEPHPMPLWTDRPVRADPSFLPDPVMSYSNSYGLDRPEDDTVPVSLLYPAPGFIESRGSIRGSGLVAGNPAAFAYVQAVRPGEWGKPAQPGPGVFVNEEGEFFLEGMSPGDWMLWVHPILVTRRNAHGSRLNMAAEAGALEFRDQWRWVRVEAGETLEDVEITVQPGREVTP